MTVAELKRNLEYTKNKHRNDFVPTGGTNITAMCTDILITIENLEIEIRADERANAIREYKSKLIKDVSARAKSYEQYSDKINAEVFNYATDTFLQALDYFAEQLKADK